MKRVLLMLPLFILLFTHCKKEEINHEEETQMVPVTFKLPLSQAKSDFSNVFPTGDVDWGNNNGVEYMYLAVPETLTYYESSVGANLKVGEMVELKAEVDGTADTLVFRGLISKYTLWASKKCSLYYFGNNGNGKEGTNVTNIYHHKQNDRCIGKRIVFTQQTGSVEGLGDFHVAYYTNVEIKTLYEGSTSVGYEITAHKLKNLTSVAMLDLRDEKMLGGTATRLQAYSVVCNDGVEFVESFEAAPVEGIVLGENMSEKSMITLLPIAEPVYLECSKGRYDFHRGIAAGEVCVGRNGNTFDEVQPLRWIKP